MAEDNDISDYTPAMITRREAVARVSALLGGVALVGGNALLTGCRDEAKPVADASGNAVAFTSEEIAFLEEVADTILPETSTPGAKAAKTGALMAVIVTDSYSPRDQEVFRAGMRKIDEDTRKAHGVSFVAATPQQRLAILEAADRDRKSVAEAREAERKKAALVVPDEREDASKAADSPAPAITADPPAHYFRMMKELALLGYFTSEIGCKQALRYEETPGRFDPCVAYTPGERAWADHA